MTFFQACSNPFLDKKAALGCIWVEHRAEGYVSADFLFRHGPRLIYMLRISWGFAACTGLLGVDHWKLWPSYLTSMQISMPSLGDECEISGISMRFILMEIGEPQSSLRCNNFSTTIEAKVCHAGCNVAVWAATAGSFDMCQWLHEKRADFASTNKTLDRIYLKFPKKTSKGDLCARNSFRLVIGVIDVRL